MKVQWLAGAVALVILFAMPAVAEQVIVNSTSGENTIIQTEDETVQVEQGSNRVIQGDPSGGVQSSSEPRLETGSVSPVFGSSGNYTWHTYFSDPDGREPEYVKIYLVPVGPVDVKKIEPHVMQRKGNNLRGVEYVYTENLTEEGQYQFYFEAKVGSQIIRNPYYGGQDCKPGLCSDCCGAWGGPKVLSERLISNNKIYLFDSEKESAVWSYDVGENWITSVAFSADGLKMAAADNRGNLYLFDVSSNIPLWTYRAQFDASSGDVGLDHGLVDFSDGELLVASLRGQVFLFNLGSKNPIWSYGVGMTLRGLEISSDGKYITAGGHDTKVYLWEAGSRNPLWEYKVESEGGILGLEGSVIRAMAMTSDGKYFTAGTSCPDRSVYVFTPDSSKPVYKARAGENFPVEDIGISDDGQHVIAVGGGSIEDAYSALLFGVGDKKPEWLFDHSKNPAISAAISPDGGSMAIGYILDGMYFLRRGSNNPIWQLRDSGYVADIDFSDDGGTLALGTGTYHVILLPIDGSSILQDWKVDGKAEAVAISPDGRYVAAGTGLDKFMSIGGAQDRNISGAGVGPLEDLGPKLVKASGFGAAGLGLAKNMSVVSGATWLNWLIVSSALCFLLSLLGLGGYLVAIKFDLFRRWGWLKGSSAVALVVNKKIVVSFVVLAGIFLALIVILVLVSA